MGKNVYLNGQIVPIEKATISVNDRGFLYGDALIETIRTYKKAPFMLKSHLERLIKSATELDIKVPVLDDLRQAVFKVLENNDINNGAIRITLSRGISLERSLYEQLEEPTILITASELDPEEIARTKNGVKALSGEDRGSQVGNHKNSSMLSSVISYKQALEKNAFDVIQITRRGFVTEGLRTNVFIVLDGILLTPPVSKRVLPGITRQLAINMAQRNGLKVEEDAIVGQDLPAAEEVFLTNSLYEIIPVTTLNNAPIANGQVGRITSSLQNGYELLVQTWLDKIFSPTT